ncbi:unnamed protein product, partial [Colletotrichum noveboracense]
NLSFRDSDYASTSALEVTNKYNTLGAGIISMQTKRDMHILNYQQERGCSPKEARVLFLNKVEADIARFRQQSNTSATRFTGQFQDFMVLRNGIMQALQGRASPVDAVSVFTDEVKLLCYVELL